ncbi:hypothetical protein [Larkinella arboricola]
MDHTITLEHFFKLLHDPVNDGFSVRYRRKEDGGVGERHGCRKSRKSTGVKAQGDTAPKPGLRYDLIEKGVVLLEDEKGNFFALRNRLLMAYRFRDQTQWYRIKHSW